MNALSRLLLLLAVLSLAVVAPTGVDAAVSCHRIDASGVGQDQGGGHTVAQIRDGGLLQGTTAAAFTIIGLSGTLASFVGTITFTSNRATLAAEVAGTLDLATGAFNATSSSLSGTGKLEGATGGLVFAGVENLLTGTFTEVVTGQVCVDLAP